MNKKLIIAGSGCAFLWAAVTSMSLGIPTAWCEIIDKLTLRVISKHIYAMSNGFYYEVNNNEMPTIVFLVTYFLIFCLVGIVYLEVERKTTQKHSLKIIAIFAVLFRLILLPGELIHENDIYRYLWDGKTFNQGINPYKYAPSDLFMYEKGFTQNYYDDDNEVTLTAKMFNRKEQRQLQKLIQLRDKNSVYFERIGHRQVPTIYPPVMQAVFSFTTWLRPDSIIFMKSVFMIFDLGVIFLIIRLLKHFQKDPGLCILYAWSPLVLKEFPNAGHYDPVVIFFMLLALYMLLINRKTASALFLGAATLTKFFTVILLPVMRHKYTLRHALIFVTGIVLAYLPFIFWDHTGINGVFEGLRTYNKEWAYNASIFALIYASLKHFLPALTQTLWPAKLIAGMLIAGLVIFLSSKPVRSDQDLLHQCFLCIVSLFIINPVGDPWYFCWSIPFLCFFPYRSWIMLSGLLILSYLNFRSDIPWVNQRLFHIPVINWIIYTPFFMAWILEQKKCCPFFYRYK